MLSARRKKAKKNGKTTHTSCSPKSGGEIECYFSSSQSAFPESKLAEPGVSQNEAPDTMAAPTYPAASDAYSEKPAAYKTSKAG